MATTSAWRGRAGAALAGVLLLSSCGGEDSDGTVDTTTTAAVADPVVDPGDGGTYAPELDPSEFVEVIDNPYLPYIPGTRWVYEGDDDGQTERVEVEVLHETREIEGITATVVHDTVYVDGELAEDTYDWFAQDVDGAVWYLGEDTHEYEDGVAVNAEGAWEYGRDGAQPGIVMPAHPQAGDAYRQELYAGEAEDMAEVLEVGVTAEIALGSYDDVVVTEDWTPLEPEVVERKTYARGVGLIREIKATGATGTIELIEHTAAS